MAGQPVINDRYFGQVPPGWSRDGYIHYLRHMVKVTKRVRPDMSEYWSQWLEKLLDTEPD